MRGRIFKIATAVFTMAILLVGTLTVYAGDNISADKDSFVYRVSGLTIDTDKDVDKVTITVRAKTGIIETCQIKANGSGNYIDGATWLLINNGNVTKRKQNSAQSVYCGKSSMSIASDGGTIAAGSSIGDMIISMRHNESSDITVIIKQEYADESNSSVKELTASIDYVEPVPSPTVTPEPTPAQTTEPTPAPTATATKTPAPSPTATPTKTPKPSATATLRPTPSATASPLPSATKTVNPAETIPPVGNVSPSAPPSVSPETNPSDSPGLFPKENKSEQKKPVDWKLAVTGIAIVGIALLAFLISVVILFTRRASENRQYANRNRRGNRFDNGDRY